MANTLLPYRYTLCFGVKASTWVRHTLTICVQQGRERKYREDLFSGKAAKYYIILDYIKDYIDFIFV